MVYDSMRKKTILFGGWQPGAGFYHPDQWEWDGTAQTWTQRQLTTQPSARYGAAVVWDSLRGWRCCSAASTRRRAAGNDTWEWDSATWTGPARRRARSRRRVTAR